ncbi:MAG: hypothetical protein Q9192_004001 [Flavoplaca navasiana]
MFDRIHKRGSYTYVLVEVEAPELIVASVDTVLVLNTVFAGCVTYEDWRTLDEHHLGQQHQTPAKAQAWQGLLRPGELATLDALPFSVRLPSESSKFLIERSELGEFGKAEVGEVTEIGLGKNVELDELVDDEVDVVSPFGLVDVADICEPGVVEDDEIDEVLIEEEVVLDMEDGIEDARLVIDTMDDVERLVEGLVLDKEVLIEEDVVLDMEDWIEDARIVVDTMDDVERLVEDLVLDKEVTGVEEVESDEEAVLGAIVIVVEELDGDGVGRLDDKAALGDEVDEANGLVITSASDELYGLVAGFVRRMLVLKALDFVEEIPVEPRVLEGRSLLPGVKEL